MIDAPARQRVRPRGRLDRRAVVLIVGLFAVTLLASRSCQQAQVRIGQKQAIASARASVDFTPRRTQIRLVRQGLNARPYWAVSLSVPGRAPDTFRRLATVRVDANTGKVAAVNQAPPAR